MLAEHLYGAAREASNAVMITVGTGIGGGLVIDGELYRGTIGAGAELGHMVIELDGRRCQGNCPGRGAWSRSPRGPRWAARAGRLPRQRPTRRSGRLLAEGAGDRRQGGHRGGDRRRCRRAIEVVALIGRRIGAALSSFANIFEPDVIVVGGGVIAAGDLLLDPGPARGRASGR